MLLKRNIPVQFIIKKVWREAIILFLVTLGIYLMRLFEWWHRPALPLSLITVLGTAISLVLAFRTNQSYDRWWEARSIWGGIVNDSRTLIRQVVAFTGNQGPAKPIVNRIANRQIAWCYSLSQSLRGMDALDGLSAYLEPNELAAAGAADNKPNALLQQHSADVKGLQTMGAIDSFGMMQMDNTIGRLCDHMGKCERIKSTVFPSTYSLFIHCFIYLFIFTIPFGLGNEFGITEIPLTTGIGVAFFLIEKTAMHMQDPFENRPTDTAMTTIATNIHRNILQMTGASEGQPAPHPPGPFYAM